MRKLSLICSAALLAAPLLASAALAQGVGRADNSAQATFSLAGVRSNAVQPQASTATINAVMASLDSAAGAAPGGVKGVSESFTGTTFVGGGTYGGDAESQAYGSQNYPYTTRRSNAWTNNGPAGGIDEPVTEYPWRATGKLWSHYGSNPDTGWFICTASLIKRGLLVTAAHCVHNYGQQNAGFANQVLWYPAETPAAGAYYGIYRGRYWYIPSVYWNGTDTSLQVGVICNNDIATVVLWANNQALATNNQAWPGQVVGWYGFGYNGYSFVTSGWFGNKFVASVTQLGYPRALDSGYNQERTDTYSQYYPSGNFKGQFIGSAQTGGSSGGPWLVNFGTPPTHQEGTNAGFSSSQAVIGVTSWGYGGAGAAYKIQGASWFGQNVQFPAANYGGYGGGNIGFLIFGVCSQAAYAPACS